MLHRHCGFERQVLLMYSLRYNSLIRQLVSNTLEYLVVLCLDQGGVKLSELNLLLVFNVLACKQRFADRNFPISLVIT